MNLNRGMHIIRLHKALLPSNELGVKGMAGCGWTGRWVDGAGCGWTGWGVGRQGGLWVDWTLDFKKWQCRMSLSLMYAHVTCRI